MREGGLFGETLHRGLLFVAVVLCSRPVSGQSSGLDIDIGQLEDALQEIANDGLGVSLVQDEYDKLKYTYSAIDGPSTVRELASSLSANIREPIAALNKLVKVIEEQFSLFSGEQDFMQCCQATDTHDLSYNAKVNLHEACVMVAGQASLEKIFPSTRVVEVMKENLQSYPSLKWQYFGGEDGTLLNYPAIKPEAVPDCERYNPRMRPFYASSVSPVPKDIVVVMDTSVAMDTDHNDRRLLDVAKEAVRAVLDTLSPNDKIAIVSFSSSASTPSLPESTCYTTSLVAATPQHVKNLKKYIDSLRASGESNYEAGLEKGFSFFKRSNSTLRDQVILFLTASRHTRGRDPVNVVREENASLQNNVVLLTYGLGALGGRVQTILQNMASETQYRTSAVGVKKGSFTLVRNPDNLNVSMATYYEFFISANSPITEPQILFSQRDIFGGGLITSICLPAYSSGRLIGVACAAVTTSELLSETTYFESGYAFVIDGYARTYSHPLLPRPYDIKDDPIFVDIHHLERSSEVKKVVSSMIRREEGNSTFMATRTKARGDVFMDGVQVESVMSQYYWAPIPDSNLSVCVVIQDGDTYSTVASQTATPEMFTYHRLDLKSAARPCKHYFKYATKGSSTVKLTPVAFREPYHYLYSIETSFNLISYERYLGGQGSSNPRLKSSILDSVVITYNAEKIWKKKQADYVVWRSIGTKDGVLRIFPGIQLAKNYDHTRTDWFHRSLAYKGKIAISPPHLDPWGSGYLITLGHTIYTGKSGMPHSGRDNVAAVMKADITFYYLYQTIQDTYPVCNGPSYQCFIIDSSGYVVIHNTFVQVSNGSNIQNVHILKKEPTVGRDLISKGILTRKSCINLQDSRELFYWEVTQVPSGGINNMGNQPQYQLYAINNSNIFLIIYKEHLQNALCNCTSALPPSMSPCGQYDTFCECPCYKNLNGHSSCSGHISTSTVSQNLVEICTPVSPNVSHWIYGESTRTETLTDCKTLYCSHSQRSDCFSVAGCSWCSQSNNGKNLRKSYCANQSVCYFGKVGQRCPYDTCEDSKASGSQDNESPNWISIISVLVFFCIFVCVTFKWIREKLNSCRDRGLSNLPRCPRCPDPPSCQCSIWPRILSRCSEIQCCKKSTTSNQRPDPDTTTPTGTNEISLDFESNHDIENDEESSVAEDTANSQPPPPFAIFANSAYDSNLSPTAPPPAYEDVVPAPPPSYDEIDSYVVDNNTSDSHI